MVKYIELGGEKRPLRFSVNALLEFEELTGIDITDPVSRSGIASIKSLRALSFVGLKHGAKFMKQEFNITIQEVGDWMDMNAQHEITAAFQSETRGDSDDESDESKKKLDGVTSVP